MRSVLVSVKYRYCWVASGRDGSNGFDGIGAGLFAAGLNVRSDTTGAGDAYRSGFVAGYLRGFDLETCGRMGSVAAVYTVEKYGTVTHTYTQKEFIKRYKENFGSDLAI